MTASGEATLRAIDGEPLAVASVRDLVVATAESIAERLGVSATVTHVDDTSITIATDAGELAAVGLVSELRRVTDRWHRGRTGRPMWRLSDEDDRHGDGSDP